ncbi:MAG: hypothetical protein QOI95_2878 [Acidimicrobiaceae bacterium]
MGNLERSDAQDALTKHGCTAELFDDAVTACIAREQHRRALGHGLAMGKEAVWLLIAK